MPAGFDWIVIILGGMGLVIWLIVKETRGGQRMSANRARLGARPVLEIDAWHASYFSSLGLPRTVTFEVLSALGAVLHVDMTRLRPADVLAEGGAADPHAAHLGGEGNLDYFFDVMLAGMVPAGSLAHVRGSRTVGELVERVAAARGEDQRF